MLSTVSPEKKQNTPKSRHSKKQDCAALQYDIFGYNIGLTYPDGEKQYFTWPGAWVTILIGLITMVFLGQGLYTLIMYEGTSVTSKLLPNMLDLKYNHTQEAGFQVAIGLSDYDYEDGFNPMDFFVFRVFLTISDGLDPDFVEIKPHKCSLEEL